MTDQEVNIIIAEFMQKPYYSIREWNDVFDTSQEPIGCNGLSFIIGNYYSKSIDSLIPVWEKLKSNGFYIASLIQREQDFFFFNVQIQRK